MPVAVSRMVTVVREAKGWTQTDLAEATGLSQGYISKVETGLLDLHGDRLDLVAAKLGCPVELLTRHTTLLGLDAACLHHRRHRTKLTAGAVKRIEALTQLTHLTTEGLLDGVELRHPHRLPRFEPAQADPVSAARELRDVWQVKDAPIDDLIELLEQAGVVVIIRDLGSNGQDAVSTWPRPDRPPLLILNAGMSPDRQRFSTAHELGHLALHAIMRENQEREANEFAAEFLTPAHLIRPSLEGITTADVRRLMDLKAQWGVSIAMLIQRAKDLHCISERQFKEFRIRLGRLGWNVHEPVDLPREKPKLVDMAIELRLATANRDLAQVARRAFMTPDTFARHYYPAADDADRTPPLTLEL